MTYESKRCRRAPLSATATTLILLIAGCTSAESSDHKFGVPTGIVASPNPQPNPNCKPLDFDLGTGGKIHVLSLSGTDYVDVINGGYGRSPQTGMDENEVEVVNGDSAGVHMIDYIYDYDHRQENYSDGMSMDVTVSRPVANNSIDFVHVSGEVCP